MLKICHIILFLWVSIFNYTLHSILLIKMFPGIFIPFTFIPDQAESAGRTQNESVMLISVIGIFNTVGRISSGWVADRPWSNSVLINAVALVIGGVATVFFTYIESYALMMSYVALFGTSIGESLHSFYRFKYSYSFKTISIEKRLYCLE